MNFDSNMISSLMKMMNAGSAQKKPFDSGADSSRHSSNSYAENGFANGFADNAQSRQYGENAFKSHNGGKPQNVNIFAAQNGLGEKIDISAFGDENKNGSDQNESTQNQKNQTPDMSGFFSSLAEQNPMFAMLGMLQGNKGSDGLSAMLPMLMSMMQKPQKPSDASKSEEKTSEVKESPQAQKEVKKKNEAKEANATEKTRTENTIRENENINTINDDDNNTVTKSETESGYGIKEDADCRNDIKKQTQGHKDMFAPIAFAGYTLISALNKLYFTSKYHWHREDTCRRAQ